jgi:nicotinate-nucleotide--dimethylbenzimidazole phosphoribosyltransferase
MTAADGRSLVEQGKTTGRRLADRGLVCLGEVGIGNTTVAAALSCALLGLPPDGAVGLGAGAAMVSRKQEVVTRAVARARTALAAAASVRRRVGARLAAQLLLTALRARQATTRTMDVREE